MKVLVSGGGTGGHIFPAVSIANELKRRLPDTDFLFVGAEGRMEMERVPKAGYKIIGLPVAGFDRKHLLRNIPVMIKLWKSMRRARKIVKDFKPDIAVGVGGYASGPVLKAAQKAGVPTLIQEQNSYAGVTNKLLAKGAVKICTAYPDMERFFPADKIVMTGNPIRREVLENTQTPGEARAALGFNPDKPLILVVGGSLGALTINQAVEAALPLWAENGLQVLWQTGKLYFDRFKPVADKYAGVKIMPFISNMDCAYKAADIVVSRAGACSVSEIQLLGKPAVLVPSPNVAEDHQRRNAEALSIRGAARMVLDANAVRDLGHEVVSLIENEQVLVALGHGAAEMALKDADVKIVDEIIKAVGKGNG